MAGGPLAPHHFIPEAFHSSFTSAVLLLQLSLPRRRQTNASFLSSFNQLVFLE